MPSQFDPNAMPDRFAGAGVPLLGSPAPGVQQATEMRTQLTGAIQELNQTRQFMAAVIAKYAPLGIAELALNEVTNAPPMMHVKQADDGKIAFYPSHESTPPTFFQELWEEKPEPTNQTVAPEGIESTAEVGVT